MKGKKKIFMFGAAVAFLMVMASQSWACPCVWSIDKSADQTELTLSIGQQLIVNYSVALTYSGGCETNSWIIYDTNFISGSNTNGYVGTVYGTWNCTDTPITTTFTYSKIIGPYYVCGDFTVDNTASLSTGENDSWTVNVHVPCVGGCTLTPGYWKTHSEYGPAPYDDTWAQLPNGADTPFFGTGKSWYEVLWTPPSGGNAYYILAHQYIAAYLNGLNGADTSVLGTALTDAAALLDTYDTTSIPRSVRSNFTNLASTLDQYNNGYTGPGHCSE